MSDTIMRECARCGEEADCCIEGLCQECISELQEEMREPDGFQEPEDMPTPVKTDLF